MKASLEDESLIDSAKTIQPLPIPGPRGLPFLGNLLDIDPHAALKSLGEMGQIYGPIFRILVGSTEDIIVGSQELVDELCDESRFIKCVAGPVEVLRTVVHDGLFTAHSDEEGWGIAHRICMPVFGPIRIREMFPEMNDLAEQLCMKWARGGPDQPIDVAPDYTRLTLDTIALCSMDVRFNSFYQGDSLHPFITALVNVLTEAQLRGQLPKALASLRGMRSRKFERDIALMRNLSLDIIRRRRENPVARDDLLNSLLYGQDPVTGKTMSDELIINNMITFLVAGHETTSGLLSFTTYYLLKHDDVYRKAREEVDEVIGSESVTVEHLSKLKYLEAVLKESLRLMPTAPGFTVKAKEPTLLAGKYAVDPKTPIDVVLPLLHYDEKAFGPDAKEFRPERMLDGSIDKLPRNAYKPFGNGSRSCIGRAFAWQEALLVMAKVVQMFDLQLDDPHYDLRYKETLTIKPDGLRIRASLRHGKSAVDVRPASAQSHTASFKRSDHTGTSSIKSSINGKYSSVSFFYGSNAGTCKALAFRLAASVEKRGLSVSRVGQLDAATKLLPSDDLVIIVTASYEGGPTDDAKAFLAHLQSQQTGSMANLRYAVFGCGHRDWKDTFFKIPKYVDERLEELGGQRICTIGTADVSSMDVIAELDQWQERALWPALEDNLGLERQAPPSDPEGDNFSVAIPLRATMMSNAVQAIVTENRSLTSPGEPEKRHLAFQVPIEKLSYESGDHFYILIQNPPGLVNKTLAYFHLTPDSIITVKSYTSLGLPANTTLTAFDLFSLHLEISEPATQKNVDQILNTIKDTTEQASVRSWMASVKSTSRTSSTFAFSVLDLLTQFAPKVQIPLPTYISMLPSLKPRIYSASSSPSWQPGHASMTFSILSDHNPATNEPRIGVGSAFLKSLFPGAAFYLSPRPAKPTFHLDVGVKPIIMICAGTGLAPFRAFIQDRILLLKKGITLGSAVLFYGCRRKGDDELYADEMLGWQEQGDMMVHKAFSRDEWREREYVQDRVAAEHVAVKRMWDQGAKVYICGNGDMAKGVEKVLAGILGKEAVEDGERVVVETFR